MDGGIFLSAEGEPTTGEDTGLVGSDGEGGDGEGGCEHVFQDTVVPATCTEQGYTLHRCTLCEYSCTDEETEIAPDNHDYQPAVTAPTCTEQGYTTYTCSRCGDSYVDEGSYTEALGHDYQSVVTEPTDMEQGYEPWTGYAKSNAPFYPGWRTRVAGAKKLPANTEVQIIGVFGGDSAFLIAVYEKGVGLIPANQVYTARIVTYYYGSDDGGGGGGGSGSVVEWTAPVLKRPEFPCRAVIAL